MNTSLFNLTGKTAFVTGSARGIGLAIATRLTQAGAHVVLHGASDSPHLTQAARALSADFIAADLTSCDATQGLISELKERNILVDILVLNASFQCYCGIDDFSDERLMSMLQANVAANFTLVKALAPDMAKRKFGRIIGISSINQIYPAERLACYSVSKAALANFMKVVSRKYAADGVTANTILPGVIETDRNREKLKDPAFSQSLCAQIPAGRFGTPDDCAPLAVFLASEEAGYITGAEIPVAGGWHI